MEDEVFGERFTESDSIRCHSFEFKLRKIKSIIPTAFRCYVKAGDEEEHCCIAFADNRHAKRGVVPDTETLKRLQEEIESPSPAKWWPYQQM
jgi:hypothetical protein